MCVCVCVDYYGKNVVNVKNFAKELLLSKELRMVENSLFFVSCFIRMRRATLDLSSRELTGIVMFS